MGFIQVMRTRITYDDNRASIVQARTAKQYFAHLFSTHTLCMYLDVSLRIHVNALLCLENGLLFRNTAVTDTAKSLHANGSYPLQKENGAPVQVLSATQLII